MMNVVNRTGIVCLLLIYSYADRVNAQTILNNYCETGIRANLTMVQMNQDYQNAIWALKESKERLGPAIDFSAGYSRNFRKPIDLAGGNTGAIAEFLAQLQTSSIKNGKFYFPNPNQYSSALQLTQNIYNPQLRYNVRVKEENSKAVASQLEDFKLELEAHIRDAYFQYMQAIELQRATRRCIEIAKDNLSLIEARIGQQKETRETLYKARMDVNVVEAEYQELENSGLKARYYFNFLLNRPLDDSIIIDSACFYHFGHIYTIASQRDTSLTGYHTDYLKHNADAAGFQKNYISSQMRPVLQLKGIAGISGSRISFNNSRLPYGTIELSLKWDLFNAGANKSKATQAYYQEKRLSVQYENSKKQIELNERSAYSDVITHLANYKSSLAQYTNASVYYQTARSKFDLQTASILVLLDAENQLWQADMNLIKWYYNLQFKLVSYQETTGKKLKLN